MKVINMNGTEIKYEAAVELMDDEIRERVCDTVDSEQEFFTAYEKEHAEKYGEEWELSKENPCYRFYLTSFARNRLVYSLQSTAILLLVIFLYAITIYVICKPLFYKQKADLSKFFTLLHLSAHFSCMFPEK